VRRALLRTVWFIRAACRSRSLLLLVLVLPLRRWRTLARECVILCYVRRFQERQHSQKQTMPKQHVAANDSHSDSSG
jgi:hypothetical protein